MSEPPRLRGGPGWRYRVKAGLSVRVQGRVALEGVVPTKRRWLEGVGAAARVGPCLAGAYPLWTTARVALARVRAAAGRSCSRPGPWRHGLAPQPRRFRRGRASLCGVSAWLCRVSCSLVPLLWQIARKLHDFLGYPPPCGGWGAGCPLRQRDGLAPAPPGPRPERASAPPRAARPVPAFSATPPLQAAAAPRQPPPALSASAPSARPAAPRGALELEDVCGQLESAYRSEVDRRADIVALAAEEGD